MSDRLRLGAMIAMVAVAFAVSSPTDRPVHAAAEAVLAEVDGTVITAADVGVARALGLFGLRPSPEPIRRTDIDRLLDARLVEQEAIRLNIEGSDDEVEAAWASAVERMGGVEPAIAWLMQAQIEPDWVRAFVEADVRRQRFVALRFQRAEQELPRWLAEARARTIIRYSVSGDVPMPFPLPATRP
jgi:hypothetical protein